MVLYSFSINLEFKVLIHPYKPDKTIAAEDCHQRQMTGALEARLEVFVSAGRLSGFQTRGRMAMKVGQELVAELFEFDEQVMGGWHVSHNTHARAFVVRELCPLIEDHHTADFGSGDKEE